MVHVSFAVIWYMNLAHLLPGPRSRKKYVTTSKEKNLTMKSYNSYMLVPEFFVNLQASPSKVKNQRTYQKCIQKFSKLNNQV